jgi:hypothetical protein
MVFISISIGATRAPQLIDVFKTLAGRMNAPAQVVNEI